jgi:hypothetical protein
MLPGRTGVLALLAVVPVDGEAPLPALALMAGNPPLAEPLVIDWSDEEFARPPPDTGGITVLCLVRGATGLVPAAACAQVAFGACSMLEPVVSVHPDTQVTRSLIRTKPGYKSFSSSPPPYTNWMGTTSIPALGAGLDWR